MGGDGFNPRGLVQLRCGLEFTCSIGAPAHQKHSARQATDKNASFADNAIERANEMEKLRENATLVVNRLRNTGKLDELQRIGTDRLVQATIARAADASAADLNGAARQAGAAIEVATAKRAKTESQEAARAAGLGAGFSFAGGAAPMEGTGAARTPAPAPRPAGANGSGVAGLSPAGLPHVPSFGEAQTTAKRDAGKARK